MIKPIIPKYPFNKYNWLSENTLENHYKKYLNYLKIINSEKEFTIFDNIKDLLIYYQNNFETDDFLKNISQAYNHEILFNSISPFYTNCLELHNNEEFWSDLIQDSLDFFGYGWIFITNKDNNWKYTILEDWKYEINNVIFNIDLWEHAYYCDYKLDKKLYLIECINHLNSNNVPKHIKLQTI